MPSIIGTSTFKGINLGITGPTGPTGPIGIAGNRGPTGLTYGPTGASGIYIINVVSNLISGGITFELSDGRILGPFYGFTGPTASYSDSRGVSLEISSGYYSVFHRVDGGRTFEFKGVCGSGNIVSSMSSDGTEILLTINPLSEIGVYGTTVSNFVIYTTDTYSATTTRIGITGTNSSLSFGITAHDGATGSSVKVYSDFAEKLYSALPLARNANLASVNFDGVVVDVDYGGYVLDLQKYSAYKLTTPVGITAFRTNSDTTILQSFTLFINGSDVWNLPDNVYFENTDKGIGSYAFLPGMNIVHLWTTNGGATFNASIVERGIGSGTAAYGASVGSCCYNEGTECVEYVSPEQCIQIYDGVFKSLSSCEENCGIFGACCSEDVCYQNVNKSLCNDINGVFTANSETCSGCGATPTTGACCDVGTCTDDVLEENCTGLKTYYSNQRCSDVGVNCTAPPVRGCCTNRSTCDFQSLVTQQECAAKGPSYEFIPNVLCDAVSNLCYSGSCCFSGGNCEHLLTPGGVLSCSGDNSDADAVVITPNPYQTCVSRGGSFTPTVCCADRNCGGQRGMCCGDGICNDNVLRSQCQTGSYWSPEETCSDNLPICNQPVITGCCRNYAAGIFEDNYTQDQCNRMGAGWDFNPGVECNTLLAAGGSCCIDGVCADLCPAYDPPKQLQRLACHDTIDSSDCGQSSRSPRTTCEDLGGIFIPDICCHQNACLDPENPIYEIGACCKDEKCDNTTFDICKTLGGIWHKGKRCELNKDICDNPPTETGACCKDCGCTETTQAVCLNIIEGVWNGTKHCSDAVPPCGNPNEIVKGTCVSTRFEECGVYYDNVTELECAQIDNLSQAFVFIPNESGENVPCNNVTTYTDIDKICENVSTTQYDVDNGLVSCPGNYSKINATNISGRITKGVQVRSDRKLITAWNSLCCSDIQGYVAGPFGKCCLNQILVNSNTGAIDDRPYLCYDELDQNLCGLLGGVWGGAGTSCTSGCSSLITGGGGCGNSDYDYVIEILNNDGTPATDIILPNSSPQEITIKIRVTHTDYNNPSAILEIPSTFTNSQGHQFTINTFGYTGYGLFTGEIITAKISTAFDPSGAKDGIKNTITAKIKDTDGAEKAINLIDFYVGFKAPTDVDYCASCPTSSPNKFKAQVKFTAKRKCKDCWVKSESVLSYPSVKEQTGVANVCISTVSGECGFSVEIDCLTVTNIQETWDCKTSQIIPNQTCTHLEYGSGIWSGNRPACSTDCANNITYGYRTQTQCGVDANPSCKGQTKIYPGCTETFDPYFNEIDFDNLIQILASRNVPEQDINGIIKELETKLLQAKQPGTNDVIIFNPNKAFNSYQLTNFTGIPCCSPEVISSENISDIFNLGFGTLPGNKTIKYLLFLSKQASKATVSLDCGEAENGGWGVLCDQGSTGRICSALYKYGIARMVLNQDGTVDTQLSCSNDLFEANTTIFAGFSNYFAIDFPLDTNCRCSLTNNILDYEGGYPCPLWSLYLLGEIKQTDLDFINGKPKLRYETVSDYSKEKQLNNSAACSSTKLGSAFFGEDWASISPKKAKYTIITDLTSIYEKYLNTLYRAAHCNNGNLTNSCNIQNSCFIKSQYVKYRYCYCDSVPGILEPLNYAGNQYMDIQMIPAIQNSIDPIVKYKTKIYGCNLSGCNPYLTTVKMDIGKFKPELGETSNPITVNTVTGDSDISTSRPFYFNTNPVIEKYGLHAAAWLQTTDPLLQELPIIGAESDLLKLNEFAVNFNNTGVQFIPSILGESASAASGSIYIVIRPNIIPPSDIAENGGDATNFITEFSGKMWVINKSLTAAKVVSLGTSDYNADGIEFTINDPNLTNSEWYSGSNKTYKLAFKMTVTAYLGSDGQGDPIYRTHTKLYSYSINGDTAKRAPKNITPIKNKLLNGECVSLDCSEVQAFCDSLPDC